MSFKLPDLVVESILKDGLNNARRDPSVIWDVFGELGRKYARKKYGHREIDKIVEIVQNQEVSIVHSYNLVNANLPCISIQLADDREQTENAHMGDFVYLYDRPYTTPEQLASTVIVPSFTISTYNQGTGIVTIPDSVDLSVVHINQLIQDAEGNQFAIIGGINNAVGAKTVYVEPGSQINVPGVFQIVSSINYDEFYIHGNIEHTQLILGIHTKEALLTKYLYTLVKYFVLSRKKDMTARGLQLDTYSGSDFHRNMEYDGNVVYSRFFNLSGIVQHSWRQDKVLLIDSIDVIPQVPKDTAGNAEIGLENQTVQVFEGEE
jgi:hypothetical protein